MNQLIRISMIVSLAVAIGGCALGDEIGDGDVAIDEYALSEATFSAGGDLHAASDEFSTAAAKDCYVRITCANGTLRSCHGSNGQCSASASGNGRVTCNGTTYACPTSTPPPPPCGRICNSSDDCDLDSFCNANGFCVCF